MSGEKKRVSNTRYPSTILEKKKRKRINDKGNSNKEFSFHENISKGKEKTVRKEYLRSSWRRIRGYYIFFKAKDMKTSIQKPKDECLKLYFFRNQVFSLAENCCSFNENLFSLSLSFSSSTSSPCGLFIQLIKIIF